VSTTWLVDETYVKILGRWHYLYCGVDQDGQVLDYWLSQTRDLAAAEAIFRRTIGSTGCKPEHVVTDKATFYPSAIRTCAPGAKHTATGFYTLVISTNRRERNHGYVKSRIRRMRGLKSFACAMRLFPAWMRCSWSNATSYGCHLSERRAPADTPMSARATSPRSSIDWARPCRTGQRKADRTRLRLVPSDPTPTSENQPACIRGKPTLMGDVRRSAVTHNPSRRRKYNPLLRVHARMRGCGQTTGSGGWVHRNWRGC
jgi:DDE domain